MAKELVSIKGTREGLIIIFDPEKEFEEIKKNLIQKIESARGFFRGARFTLHNKQQSINHNQQKELEDLCAQYGLIPSKNLSWQRQHLKKVENEINLWGEPARLVYRTLRSGQRIFHSGHVVIVGNVHPGAEVAATGNIAIMGSCLGNVYAGIKDNKQATITALRLTPTRLTIAGVEAPPVSKKNNPPHLARLANGKVIFEKLL